MGFAKSSSGRLRNADIPDLALLYKFCDSRNARLVRHVLVYPCALEQVKLLLSVENLVDVFDARPDVLRRAKGHGVLRVRCTLDGEEGLVCVLRVLREEACEHLEVGSARVN